MTNEIKRLSKEEVLAKLRDVRSRIRITKITCSRTAKSRNGDSFVGFSASYRTFQGGADDDLHQSVDEDLSGDQGATLSDAKLARYVLSMECDIAALESAMINGGITSEYFRDAVRGVQNGYNQLILREMGVVPDDSKG